MMPDPRFSLRHLAAALALALSVAPATAPAQSPPAAAGRSARGRECLARRAPAGPQRGAHVSAARRRRRVAARRHGARRARLLRGGARHARRAARPSRNRDFARRAPAHARARIGAAVVGARTDGRAPEAGDRRSLEQGQRGDVRRLRFGSQGGARARARRGRGLGTAAGRSVPAAQPAARERAGQGRDVQARAHAGAALSQRRRRRISPSRSPRTTPACRTWRPRRSPLQAIDRALALKPLLGAGDPAQGGDPRASSRRTAPPTTSSSCCKRRARSEGGALGAGAGPHPAEALRGGRRRSCKSCGRRTRATTSTSSAWRCSRSR